MMHPRTLIRNRVQEILVTANVAGGNVLKDGTLIDTLIAKDLPAVGIWMWEDNVEEEENGPRRRTNVVNTLLRCVVVPGGDVQEKLETLELEIMAVLDTDRYLGGAPREFTNDVRKSGTTMSLIPIGDAVTGYSEIEYEIEYFDYAPARVTVTTPFQTLEATYNPNGTTDPGNQPSDLQEFPGAP